METDGPNKSWTGDLRPPIKAGQLKEQDFTDGCIEMTVGTGI